MPRARRNTKLMMVLAAYRAARYPLHPSPVETDFRGIYHSLWPYRPLSPVPDEKDPLALHQQSENEAAYRQLLVQGVLAVLLPTEDLENDCLTSLVGQIFSEMILGNGIGGKACEPWLIWEGITKAFEIVEASSTSPKARENIDESNSNATDAPADLSDGGKSIDILRPIQKTLLQLVQYGMILYAAVRFLLVTLISSSSAPSRLPGVKVTAKPLDVDSRSAPISRVQPPTKEPILAMKVWPCLSNLLDLSTRMPWLSSTMSLLQWAALHGPGEVGGSDGLLDRYVKFSSSSMASRIQARFAQSETGASLLYVRPHEISVT